MSHASSSAISYSSKEVIWATRAEPLLAPNSARHGYEKTAGVEPLFNAYIAFDMGFLSRALSTSTLMNFFIPRELRNMDPTKGISAASKPVRPAV